MLRHEFDPVLLLPPASYLRQFVNQQRRNFPQDGWPGEVYTGPLENLEKDLKALDWLVTELETLAKEGDVLRRKNTNSNPDILVYTIMLR